MKVADLEGLDLDYLVFKAEHPETRWTRADWETQSIPYSVAWQWGGPIIEREQITVICDDGKWEAFSYWKSGEYEDDHEYGVRMEGETALIAAMRCLVANKFGVGAFKDELPDSAIDAPQNAGD
ncbi:phage protein NinX family protein [Paraburkholderia elongata]|uniref:DUF2591 domain-containing protein n=1 Tax=Paraburkholderia elongata TaxID=2675747 RepID=A0A972NVH2_9BURK|nr:phage protein NinX family protein [Paraburkholderia elongata]NPT59134.1 DUF2591 domain-containing protein [Paraburkholderia elongata]